jgi:predicted RNase H-like HicB family nuclease
MPRIPILIEQGTENYSAYAPDLHGCVATGKSLDELKANMQKALRMHLEGMQEDGEPLPVSYSLIEFIEIHQPTPEESMLKIPIIIEQGEENYGAYPLDLPGCFSTGKSLEEVRANVQEAILLYLEDIKENGQAIPLSYSLAEYIELSQN